MNTQFPASISRQIFQKNIMSSACRMQIENDHDSWRSLYTETQINFSLRCIWYWSMSILRIFWKVKRFMDLLQESYRMNYGVPAICMFRWRIGTVNCLGRYYIVPIPRSTR